MKKFKVQDPRSVEPYRQDAKSAKAAKKSTGIKGPESGPNSFVVFLILSWRSWRPGGKALPTLDLLFNNSESILRGG